MKKQTQLSYPKNHFQTLIEVATTPDLPAAVREHLGDIPELLRQNRDDEAVNRFCECLNGSYSKVGFKRVFGFVVWLCCEGVALPEDAKLTGAALNQALVRRSALESGTNVSPEDLAAANRHIETVRSLIRNNAALWRLPRLTALLRRYRDVCLEAKSTGT